MVRRTTGQQVMSPSLIQTLDSLVCCMLLYTVTQHKHFQPSLSHFGLGLAWHRQTQSENQSEASTLAFHFSGGGTNGRRQNRTRLDSRTTNQTKNTCDTGSGTTMCTGVETLVNGCCWFHRSPRPRARSCSRSTSTAATLVV